MRELKMGSFRRLKQLLFPPRCAACEDLLDWNITDQAVALCPRCAGRWESEKRQTCEVCAKPVTACDCMPEALEKAKCAAFRKLVYYTSGTRETVQNRVIFRIKNKRDERTPVFLARELLCALEDVLRTNNIDQKDAVLTYIPRAAANKRRYGTDQAEAPAGALSAISGVECRPLLVRKGRRSEQKQLNAAQRARNVRDAFVLSPNALPSGKAVILLDDVVTTGSSMAAGVRLLRRAGAREVFCFAIAFHDISRK